VTRFANDSAGCATAEGIPGVGLSRHRDVGKSFLIMGLSE
jgi:hypothetical protein